VIPTPITPIQPVRTDLPHLAPRLVQPFQPDIRERHPKVKRVGGRTGIAAQRLKDLPRAAVVQQGRGKIKDNPIPLLRVLRRDGRKPRAENLNGHRRHSKLQRTPTRQIPQRCSTGIRKLRHISGNQRCLRPRRCLGTGYCGKTQGQQSKSAQQGKSHEISASYRASV
jgi:hypothetical protein